MNVLHERLRALLELRTDSPALLEALDSVASVAGGGGDSGLGDRGGAGGLTTDAARRSLRGDVEARGLGVLRAFIARLEPVEERMLAFEASVGVLARACERARDRIERSEADTAAFLAQAEALGARRDALGEQLTSVTAFLSAYELAPAEADALATGPQPGDGGAAFFAALARVGDVRAKSQALLTGRDQALGLELLDAATQQEADALDRLFAWATAVCRDAEQLAGGALQDAGGGAGGGADVDAPTPATPLPPSPHRTLRRALAVLRARRPPYFRACQDAAVASRRAAFVRRFVRALSGSGGGAAAADGASGGGDSAARPIDLHAHDPLRYVGDMLAWVHTNVAEEAEVVGALFGGDGAADIVVAAAATPPSDDAAAAPPAPPPLTPGAVLAAIADGVARPLAARIDQVVSSVSTSVALPPPPPSAATGGAPMASGQSTPASPLVVVFRIADVLAFYAATLGALLPSHPPSPPPASAATAAPGAGLLTAIAASHAHAVERFGAALSAQAARTRAAPPAYPSDLTASPLVTDACRLLDELLRAYGASLAAAGEAKAAGGGGRPAPPAAVIRVDDVLSALLSPLLDSCRGSAEGLRVADTAIFMLNNTSALGAVLAAHAFTAGWVQRLAAEGDAWEEGLVQQSANDLLSSCGLLPKLGAMRAAAAEAAVAAAAAAAAGGGAPQPPLPLSAVPGLQPHDLRPVVAAFYAELSSPTLVSLFDRVANPRVRSRVRRATAAVLAAAYARLYADVTNPSHRYADACDVDALVRRTPADVEALLDLR